ncbi:NADH-quinone oxidoreductase subunit B family protein [Thermofilum pendens]|uniref:NADH-quinone oxidoreductase, B subunit n=1 Tax=Thermofilum pendens (strain DSM 2475 / Hrk 5) TaxID=368408 RepID=A1RZ39_THEPD|nr:NADH-quinone oxidoreductase subunit B family protein [Thermofilum pendens]ABL78469.1 NADH-quinone oxidoreductase, B subunit [Thermofilum pendens Hrk 5]
MRGDLGFRRKSLWVYHFNSGGCNGCDIEFVAALTPRFDLERLGVQLVPSPRHADVLVVTGPVTRASADALKTIYDQVPEPRIVVAFGTCACSGGVFSNCYNVLGGADKVLPVDVKIPGCPPKPESLLHALSRIVLGEANGGR